MKFKGKQLLILGSNVGSDDIVKYARSNGAYTIVADYYPDNRSSAKRIADESLLISTADIDALNKEIKSRKIDGVLAGIGEFNLLNAMKLCELNDLPFYCNKNQWDLISNKRKFRELCIEFDVPCPKTYFSGIYETANFPLDKIKYPVVLKPVDANTSSGVHICLSEGELLSNIPDSIKWSKSGQIIIEEYVQGKEFTAHFVVCDGKAYLTCVDNRYPVALHEGCVTTIPVARLYPSLFAKEFEENVSGKLVTMLESLGLKNAVVFVQGIYDSYNCSFAIFEGGLRSAGEAPYRFIEKINGVNYMSMLVDNALSQPVSYDPKREDPYLKGMCCGVISFVSKGGVVGKIDGLENAVEKCQSVITYENRYPVGSETPCGDTLRQLMMRFVLICKSRKQMSEDINYLNKTIDVKDSNGVNLVVKMDPLRVFGID